MGRLGGAPSTFVGTDVLWFGAAAVTAATDNRFLNPVGYSTTPAPTTHIPYLIPRPGWLEEILYRCQGAHTTNTIVVKPRHNGSNIDLGFSVAANVLAQQSLVSLAVARGDSVGCYINHTGATGLVNVVVGFRFKWSR